MSASHSLGGSSRPGRIIGPSLDRIIKNAAWRKHTLLVSSCKSSLDLLQSLTDTTATDSSSSPLLGLSPSDSSSLLSSLILALDSSSPKLIEPALDSLLRLLSLRLLRGHVDPSSPTPTLSALFDSICSLTASAPDDAVELSVLKLFLAALRSEVLLIRGDPLVNIVKSCYNVYLGSPSALNQVVAKLVLAQILRIVYARVDMDSMRVKVQTVSVADLLDLSDKSLNDSNLVQAAQGFIDEAMAWSGDEEGGEGLRNGGGGGGGEGGEGGGGGGELSKIREDGIYLFRNLCKFSMKFASNEGPEDPLLLRGKVLSLELLKMVVENAGPIWRTNDK